MCQNAENLIGPNELSMCACVLHVNVIVNVYAFAYVYSAFDDFWNTCSVKLYYLFFGLTESTCQ